MQGICHRLTLFGNLCCIPCAHFVNSSIFHPPREMAPNCSCSFGIPRMIFLEFLGSASWWVVSIFFKKETRNCPKFPALASRGPLGSPSCIFWGGGKESVKLTCWAMMTCVSALHAGSPCFLLVALVHLWGVFKSNFSLGVSTTPLSSLNTVMCAWAFL